VATLETSRLRLLPLDLKRARAALMGRAELARLIGAQVPEAWPNDAFSEALPVIAKFLEGDPTYAAWTRLVVHQVDRILIGEVGFKSKPDRAGKVEIGYGIVPAYRRRGYASEAAEALIAWAFAQGVRRVTAECLADNLGSIRVLGKLGMRRLERSGDMLYWALTRPPESGDGGR
jgi:[ribosomal protein S5]-alanine N-acetyltransferase